MTTRRERQIAKLDPYRVTSHGQNPWTNEAYSNVLANREHYGAARVAINGKITSCYRSPQINKAVGGAATSRHLRGLACDIVPGPAYSIETATRLIWELALDEKLGLVQQVIWEPSWVHVGWYAPSEQDAGMRLLRQVGKSQYETLATWTETKKNG